MQPKTAEVDIQLQPEFVSKGHEPTMELVEGVVPAEEGIEFPPLETKPEVVSEPSVTSSTPVAEPILLTESEAQEESEIKDEARVKEATEEVVPMEEDVEVTGAVALDIGEEQPDVLQQVAAKAEAVAEAVAAGEAVVVEGVDGRTIIVLEDDGTILDEGLSSFAIKEEIVREDIHEEPIAL